MSKLKFLLLFVPVVLINSALAADPTSLDGFTAVSDGYISQGRLTAIAAAAVGFGWVGYRIIKKFTKGVTST